MAGLGIFPARRDRLRIPHAGDGAYTIAKAERALFTRRRKEIYEALHPETRPTSEGGSNRRKLCDDADRLTADTATKTGVDRRTVERDAARGENGGSAGLEPATSPL